MAFKPFGLEERAPIPDSVRRDGFKSFGTKGFPGPYYNSAIFEASQDHVLGTQAQVTLGQATCYYASTADFRDKDNAVVTFVAYDRINIVIDQMERDIIFPAVKLEFIAHSQFDMNGFDMSIPGDCSGRLEGTNTSATVSVITITGTSSLLKISGDTAVDDSGAGGKVMINGLFRINWTSASLVGSGLTISGIGGPALTTLNSTDIALIGSTQESLRVYRWTGSWAQVGSGLTITGAGAPALAALNGTDVAYIDGDLGSLRTYRWTGSWAQVGASLAITGGGLYGIAALSGTDIALVASGLDVLRLYRFDGANWAQVGSDFSIPGVGAAAVTKLNDTDIAFVDSNLESIRAYRFDYNTGSWSQISSSFSVSPFFRGALTALNVTDVAFVEDGTDSLRIYRLNGSDWESVGTGLTIPGIGNSALTAFNSTDVAFIDLTLESLRTYRFGFSP